MIKINNLNNADNILNFLQSQGMINLDTVQESMRKKEKERLLSKHSFSIFFDEKEKRWRTTIPDETKPNGRRSIARKNLDDLHDVLVKYYADLEDEKYLANTLYTLETIFPIWLKYKNSQTNASSYIKRIIVDWNKFYKGTPITKVLLKDLTYLQLNEWAHNIVKDFSLNKKQYNNMALIMRQCLDYACEPELDIIKENPFSRVKIKSNLFNTKPKPKSNTQVFLTVEQSKICKEALYKFHERPWYTSPLIILLNFQLGLRIGELVALKWEDIEGNYLNVQRMETLDYSLTDDGVNTICNGYKVVPYVKSDAGVRQLYLNKAARDILHQIKMVNMKYGLHDDNYIYVSKQSASRGTSRALSQYLTDLCIDSGIVPKSSHKIRKTFISSLFDKNINVNTVREIAGHEDERTTLNNYCFDQSTNDELEKELESAANMRMKIGI